MWGVATLVCPALLSMGIRLPLFQEALNTAAADIRTCLCVGMFSFHVGNTQGGIAGSWGLGTVSVAVLTAMRVSDAHRLRMKFPVGPRAREHLLMSNCFIFATESTFVA